MSSIRVSEDSSKFILPNGVVTSGSELKSLQHKLLQNHYSHSPFNSSKNILNSHYNPTADKQKYLMEYDNKSRLASQQFKSKLTSDLLAQIQYKNTKKQLERRQNIQEENKLIRNAQKFDSLEKQKLLQFKNKYKKEVQQDLQLKNRKRQSDRQSEHSKKQYNYNRYSISRSGSLGIIQNKLYTNPTQQYCYQIQQARKAQQSYNSNNPQSLKRNSSFKITNNQQKIQKIDSMYSSSLNQDYKKHYNYLQILKNKSISQKQQLRQSLLTQIKQKQQQNKQQKMKNHQLPYTTKDYKILHHPINNPVDFKYAHDNHYVLGELKSIV